MSDDPTPGKSKNTFEDDDLDDAVIAADDTGMVASEKFIVEAEIEEAVEEPDER